MRSGEEQRPVAGNRKGKNGKTRKEPF